MTAAATAAPGPAVGAVVRPDALSFGGAGFLIFYYIGIVEVLTKLGLIQPGTRVAGASSGALISTSLCSGLSSTPEMLAAAQDLVDTCREQNRCAGTLDMHVRATLQKHLPPEGWKKCKDTAWIALSQALPIVMVGQPQPLLVSGFTSQSDLIAAAAASSFIPMWSSCSITTLYRGMPVVDGSVALPRPCPPGMHCLHISASNPAWNSSGGQLATFLSQMIGSATQSTEPGQQVLPPITSTGPDGQADPALLKLAAEKGVDIAPGIFNKLPFSQRDWENWIISPPSDDTLMHIYKLGRADAELWAKTRGLVDKPAVAAATETEASAAAKQSTQKQGGAEVKLGAVGGAWHSNIGHTAGWLHLQPLGITG